MAGRRGSIGIVVGLVVTLLMISGNGVAQSPPGSVPPAPPATGPAPQPEPQPQPVPNIPTAPQAVPPAPPGVGSSGPLPGVTPVPFNGPGPVQFAQPAMPAVQRFNFKILPNTPTKTLLPTPPSVKPIDGPVMTDDLAKIPEAEFQARPEKIAQDGKLTEQAAYQLAKINHMNAKKADAFMAALLESRPDLAGLPFAMGDSCRTIGERTKQFTIAVNMVRQALGGNRAVSLSVPVTITDGTISPTTVVTGQVVNAPVAPPTAPSSFWTQFNTICEQADAARPTTDKALAEHVTLARIAALMQMLAPESAELRLGLVKYLTGVPHVEATKALARIAIFAPEDTVRLAAIESLKVRREKDYTDILVKGLRYPWPAVAKRSADAITKIGRTDLIPELIAVLAESDPRMPAMKEVDGKKVAVVHEMVKVNHHRNCMMCHSPGNSETVSADAITAEVPIQGQPLPLPSEGYRQSSPDLMIRVDVTYLRQDFSAMLTVPDAHPWPDSQRFDFFVRERKLTAEEAVAYREKLTPKEEGVQTPYHRAVLVALREMTGKDTAPTAEAWRKLLKLPGTADVKTRE